MAEGAGSYKYQTLKKNEIRLLKLITLGDDNTLCVQLRNFTFDEASPPRYTAFSYCWGDGPQDQDLCIDEAVLSITQTLVSALRNIWHSQFCEQWLWVDQICINQTNSDEKNQQVQMMGSIYSATFQLIIWLGDESEDTELAFTTTREACQEFDSKGQLQSIMQTNLEEVTMVDKEGVLNIDHWLAVLRILRRPWFNRLWVVQEICLPDTDAIVVLCSQHQVEWWQLAFIQMSMARYNWLQHGPKLLGRGDPADVVKWKEIFADMRLDPPLVILRRTFKAGIRSSILDYIWQNRNRGRREAADRIFALRGLWNLEEQRKFEVNYNVSVSKLYVKRAQEIIKSTKDLGVLGACLPAKRNCANLPSWVPDWTIEDKVRPTRLLAAFSKKPGGISYNVLPRRVTAAYLFDEDEDDEDVLVLDGYVVQVVRLVSKDRVREDAAQENGAPERVSIHTKPAILGKLMWEFWGLANRTQIAQDIISDKRSSKQAQYTDNLHAAFWKTLIVNRDAFGRPADYPGPQQGAAYFSAFVQSIDARKFFITEEGDIGLGPYDIPTGDLICASPGANVPFVLRNAPSTSKFDLKKDRQYTLVGECYCHTLMEGIDVSALDELQRFEIQ